MVRKLKESSSDMIWVNNCAKMHVKKEMQFYVHVAPKHRVTLAMLGKIDIKTKQRDQWINCYKIS